MIRAVPETATETPPRVAVIGLASTVVAQETSRSLEEMIFQTSREALHSAGLTMSDIDSVVLSGNDEIDGRVITIMAASGPSGSVGRDTTLIGSAGDHALVHGVMRVQAHQGPLVLVVGWAKPSESDRPDHAELVEAEPFLLRQIGMNHTVAAALLASALGHNITADQADKVIAWPLTRKDLPGRGDSVHALILAAEGAFDEGRELAWVSGLGWATSAYDLSSRDLSAFEALRGALDHLNAKSPRLGPSTWDIVEIGASCEPAVEAVRHRLELREDTRVNPSGPLAEDLSSPHVWGLSRMVRAIKAAHGGAQTVAGIGFHGFAGQGATVIVFEGRKDVQS